MWYEEVMILAILLIIDKTEKKRHSEHSVEYWKDM